MASPIGWRFIDSTRSIISSTSAVTVPSHSRWTPVRWPEGPELYNSEVWRKVRSPISNVISTVPYSIPSSWELCSREPITWFSRELDVILLLDPGTTVDEVIGAGPTLPPSRIVTKIAVAATSIAATAEVARRIRVLRSTGLFIRYTGSESVPLVLVEASADALAGDRVGVTP